MKLTKLFRDSTNYVFNFPLAYHKKIVDAIRAYGSMPICKVANLSDSLIQLRKSIDCYNGSSSGTGIGAEEIGKDWDTLLYEARELRLEDDPFVQATSWAIELILYLSWGVKSEANLTFLAGELKEALCRLSLRPCMFMDLTSCQLMLGAIAASEASNLRAWFVARLRMAILALRSRGWAHPLKVLEGAFFSYGWIESHFRALWEELDG